MAITSSTLGRVDLPLGQVGQASVPPDLSASLVDVTLGATSDYATNVGIDLTTAATAAGITQVLACIFISIRTTGGAWKVALAGATTFMQATTDGQTSASVPKLRLWLVPTAGGTALEVIGATHLIAGDIVRVLLIGV